MKREASWRWVVALIVALALVAGLAVWWARRPAPEPPLTPTPTVPAALPPATGIDGNGLAAAPQEAAPDGLPVDPEALPADVQAQPDAGSPAVVVPQGEGVGGEVFVRSPAWAGAQRLNAGFRYPSGSLHAAWDIGISRGTKVFAARAGKIVGRNDGVRNHPSGSAYAVGGSPSNWVLLCSIVKGKPAVLYYQHLSPGLSVSRGQTVKQGQLLARSGNTGNSTGDHLHISSSYSPWGCSSITASRAEYLRYDYLRTASRRVFAPSLFWASSAAKPAPAAQNVGARLNARQWLTPGQGLFSPNGRYRAIMQGDGNFVVYDRGRAIWSSRTNRQPGAALAMQGDGNLVVYRLRKPLWSSRTHRHPGAYVVMQSDGNLVIYKGRALWSSKYGRR